VVYQRPVHWVLGLSQGQSGRSVVLTTQFLIALGCEWVGTIPLPPICACIERHELNFNFTVTLYFNINWENCICVVREVSFKLSVNLYRPSKARLNELFSRLTAASYNTETVKLEALRLKEWLQSFLRLVLKTVMSSMLVCRVLSDKGYTERRTDMNSLLCVRSVQFVQRTYKKKSPLLSKHSIPPDAGKRN
jgi:hypothetical protein